MSLPPAVTLSVQRLSVAWLPSAQLVDDRGAIEPNVPVADQTFRNSKTCRMRKLMRRPAHDTHGGEV